VTSTTAQRTVPVEEAVAYGLLTALGAYVVLTSFGYGLLLDGNRVGPGMLPCVAGGLLTAISAVKLVLTLRGAQTPHDRGLARVAASAAPEVATHEDDDGPDIFGRTPAMRMRQLKVVFLALTATVVLVPLLGFLTAFFALSLFISAVVEQRRWLPSAVISLVSVAVVYAIFVSFLGVPLPTGLLGLGG
jgi:hypothetical protein